MRMCLIKSVRRCLPADHCMCACRSMQASWQCSGSFSRLRQLEKESLETKLAVLDEETHWVGNILVGIDKQHTALQMGVADADAESARLRAGVELDAEGPSQGMPASDESIDAQFANIISLITPSST